MSLRARPPRAAPSPRSGGGTRLEQVLRAGHAQRQRQLSIGMDGGTGDDADASAVALLTSPAAQAALAAIGAVAMEVLKTAFWERLRDNVLSKARVADPFDQKDPYLDQAQVERVDKALMGVWDDLAKRLPNLVDSRPRFLGRSTALSKVRYREERTGPTVRESHDWHDDAHFETSEHCINILFSALPRGEGGEGLPSGTIFREEAGPREGTVYQNAAVGNQLGVQIFPGTSTVLDHADPFRYAQPAPGRLVVLFRIPTKAYHTAENNEDYRVAVEAIRAALLELG